MTRFLLAMAAVLTVAMSLTTPTGRADALPVGDPAVLQSAQDHAVVHWGAMPCQGVIDVSWGHLDPLTNAHSTWYGYDGVPSSYSRCVITMNIDARLCEGCPASEPGWDAAKFCTVMEHEYGHLLGHNHVDDPTDVMSPLYEQPSPDCSTPVAVVQKSVVKTTKPKRKHRRLIRRWGQGWSELGMTDRTLTPTAIAQQDMKWTRIITDATADRAITAQQIRDAHAAGLKVVLTVGGIGTNDRFNYNPHGFGDSIKFVNRLPRVEYLSIENEPDLDGIKACSYYKGWMKARRVFGKRLLFGEFSPHAPLTFTQAVVRCGKLPARLWVSIHPYQWTDPLAPPPADDPWAQGGIGGLKKAAVWLKHNTGVSVRWVPTEFGYCTRIFDREQPMTDELAVAYWPRAIKRFDQLKVPFAIIYVADGATWRSAPFVR